MLRLFPPPQACPRCGCLRRRVEWRCGTERRVHRHHERGRLVLSSRTRHAALEADPAATLDRILKSGARQTRDRAALRVAREARIAGWLRESPAREGLALLRTGATRGVHGAAVGGLRFFATDANGHRLRAVGVGEQRLHGQESRKPFRPVARREIRRNRRAIVRVQPPGLDDHGACIEQRLRDRPRPPDRRRVDRELQPGLVLRQAEVAVDRDLDAALAAAKVDVDRRAIGAGDLLAPQHRRIRHELKARSDLEPQRVHVDPAQALRVDRAAEMRVDPRVEIEVWMLERGELVARRWSADQIDRQRAKVSIVGQRPARPAVMCDGEQRQQESDPRTQHDRKTPRPLP